VTGKETDRTQGVWHRCPWAPSGGVRGWCVERLDGRLDPGCDRLRAYWLIRRPVIGALNAAPAGPDGR